MANKNKGKVIQMLSPENYIRKKARSLPIHECLINTDWEDSGMASIVVSRRHTNGNITFCLYMVDLLCLGVKDSIYKFNVTESEFRNFIETMEESLEMVMTEYVLVHNIILSALEFAEEYGFKPHKDFTSVTEFMLEEDTDDIELMEIECGRDGKPLYIQGPYEDTAKANKIIKQLEHAAGPENFDFIQEVGSDFEDEFEDDWEDEDDFDEDDDLDEDDDDEYDDWEEVKDNLLKNDMFPIFSDEEIKESKKIIFESVTRVDKLKPKELTRFTEALSMVFVSLCDREKVAESIKNFEREFEHITKEIPNQMLGIENRDFPNSQKIKELFVKGYYQEGKKLKKTISQLREEAGEIAGVANLELLYLQSASHDKLSEKLKHYYTIFPENPMVKISYHIEKIIDAKNNNNFIIDETRLTQIFGNRRTLHRIEWYNYFVLLLFKIGTENNPSKLLAFTQIINNQNFSEDELYDLTHTSKIVQLECTLNNLKK